MKKRIIVLVVVILILGVVIGFILGKSINKNTVTNNQIEADEEEQFYGTRGNISQVETIKFLSKNDEYLVGMIGLQISNEVVNFSNDDMIRFALNVAINRYSDMLTEKTYNGVTGLLVDTDVVSDIIEEYFGVSDISFVENSYYSSKYGAFLFDEDIAISLYYYPVSMEKNEETGNTEIIADAIFISDDQETSVIESAKYEGKYNEENVDNTIRFIFNSEGKLVSYQYQ